MTPDELRDPILMNLARLSVVSPDPARSERVRSRGRAELTRRRHQAERMARRRILTRRFLAPAFVGGFCLLYLSAVVYDVMQLYVVR
ncbi:MAG: hypothetical protein ACM4AI_04015 [Acidobacteriota bacterium]